MYKMICDTSRVTFLILLLIFVGQRGSAQCISTNFSIANANICQEEAVALTNTSAGTDFIWDFCSYDIETVPVETTVASINDFSQTFGFDAVSYNNNWYGFVTNRGTNTLLRLDYGSSLENIPSVTNLGNPGNLLGSPEDIEVININGNWYALITLNQASPNNVVILYDFGTDITNSAPTGKSLGNFGLFSVIRGISAAYNNDRIILALAQSNFKVTLINFRDSFDNTINAADKIVTDNLLNASTIFSVDIYNKCDEWFIFTASYHRLHQLNFGNDLFRLPIGEESYLANDIGSVPFDIDAVSEGDSTYVFVGNLDASFFLYNFNDFTNPPSLINHIVNPVLTDFSVNYSEGKFILAGVRNSTKSLTRVNYQSDCGASSEYSYEIEPDNIFYNSAGTHSISLTSVNGDYYSSSTAKEVTVSSDVAPDIDFSFENICLSNPINFTSINTSGDIVTYNWNFGDTGTSSSQNPSHTYTVAGDYTVNLLVTSSAGCVNFVEKQITIYDEPVPSFTLPAGNLCSNQTYMFDNTTTGTFGGNITYEWFINGISVGTTEDLSYLFTSGGAKEIKLVASIPGCSVEAIQNLANVDEGAKASYNVDDNACLGTTFQFSNTSTGDIVSYHWDFGNGVTSVLVDPSVEYTDPGIYNVTLTLENTSGCITDSSSIITVHEIPVVAFNNDPAYKGFPTQFNDQSTIGDATLTLWNWYFDDPTSDSNISTVQNPVHTFSTSGDFNVKLIVESSTGCRDSVIQVVSVVPPPTGDFQCLLTDFTIEKNSVCQGEKLQFSNPSAGTNFIWDFCASDMNAVPTETTVSSVTEFSQPFGFDVVNQDGNWYGFVSNRGTNTLLRLDYGSSLQNVPVVMNLGNPGDFLNSPEDIDIININENWYALIALNLAAPNNGVILYDFGSDITNLAPTGKSLGNFGISSIIRGVSAAYNNSNIVLALAQSNSNITLINFRDSFDNTINAADKIVTNNLLNASTIFSLDVYNRCDEWYIFAASYHQIHQLNFGNDLFRLPIGEESYLANDIGSVPFDIEAVSEGDSTYVFVGNLDAPFILYNFNDFTNPPSLINHTANPVLTDFSVNYSEGQFVLAGAGNSIKSLIHVSYQANCGASIQFSTETEPENISYSSSGTHNIRLTSVNGDYNNSVTKQVTVTSDIAPDIDLSSENICLSNPINFTSINTSGDIITYNWDFGDTNASTAQDPSHTYSSAGTYTVTLSVSSSSGCDNFVQKEITIYEEPVAAFSLPQGNICTNDSYFFENTTPGDFGGNITYEWFIDGVSVSTAEDLNYQFITGGAKEVKLIATIPGCSVEAVQNMSNVDEGALPAFTVDDGCVNKSFQFNNNSTGDIVTYQWDFGNGFTSSLESPSFQYAEPGTYDVSLTLTNATGCVTDTTSFLTVFELPDVSFTNDLACEGSSTQFTDQTTIGDANISTWSWNFDDPASGDDTYSERNPDHAFSSSGNFDVKLVAQTTNGCRDSVTQVVNVLPAPQAAFDYDKLCLNQTVQFEDLSEPVAGENITSWGWDLGGVFSAEQNPQTTFEFAKDYNIGLTVQSENLCSSTVYKTITISPVPNVSFGVEDACDNAEVHFFDTTDPLGVPITTRNWNFADLATQTDSSTYYSFSEAGIYTVRLRINTENGCEYSISDQVQVHAAPTAAFTTPITFGAPPLEVPFVNESVNAATYQWFFGDGGSSVEAEPVHIFFEEGRHEIELIATDVNGCSDSTSRAINVVDPDLELELAHLFPVENSDGTQLVMMLKNNGTIIIDSIRVSIDLGSQLSASELIKTTVMPGQQVNVPLNLSFINRSLDFVCVTAEALVEGVEEIITTNNSRCLNFEDDIAILKPYPNPGNGIFHLTVVSNETGFLSFQLISPKGNVVKDLIVNSVGTGYNDIVVDASDVESGLYIMKVTYKDKTEIFRMMIQNGLD